MRIIFFLFFTAAAAIGQAASVEKSLSDIRIEDYYSAQPQLTISSTSESVQNPAQREFWQSFLSLIPVLRKSELSLDRWFREDHIVYFADYMTPEEKKEMIKIIEELKKRIQAGGKSIDRMLIGAGPAFVIAKAGKLDREVLRFKDQHKDVIRFAISKHEAEYNQMYGDEPYSYHLRQVRSVLKRFGFGPKDSLLGLKLGTAAWLHDVIEDTNVTYDQVWELFGHDIAIKVISDPQHEPKPKTLKSLFQK